MNFEACFPLAQLYRRADGGEGAVCEQGVRFQSFPYSERHLQCVWYDPSLRPPALFTHEGEAIEVEHPGEWNLEAGPDFLGAVLRVGPARRRLSGDVEVHIHPNDWRAHGHRHDSRYGGICAHVTFFPGALPKDELPPGAIQIALKAPLAARPGFSFDAIDLSAYPFSARAEDPPCRRVLRQWDPPAKWRMLEAAGQARLQRKAMRLAGLKAEKGPEQTLYEETLAVLGYKHNKQPFRALAERVPVAELAEVSRGQRTVALAVLLGAADLLPARLDSRWDAETKAYVRELWDIWFRYRERWAERPAGFEWRMAGLRPTNHPVRRMAAAALLFCDGGRALLQSLAVTRIGTGRPFEELRALLCSLRHDYWDYRYSWSSSRASRPVALLGEDRIRLFIANVGIPFVVTEGASADLAARLLEELPPEADNAVIRKTAHYLFGPHHPPSWYRNELRRQGLIQIFHDFCIQDRSRCAACPFPRFLESMSGL